MPDHQPTPAPILTRRNGTIALLLFMLFTGVYWLTYSGVMLSGDEIGLFDGTESLARRGNTRVTYGLNERLLRDFTIGDQPATPLVDSEPMQMLLGAGLFLVAEALPGIGLVHAVWLLNVLVCAAAVSVMFLFACVLGYDTRTGVSAGLLFGLGTIIWPYSKVFFREPLSMLLLFSAALCLYAWRQRWRGLAGWGWFAGFVILLLLGLLSKEAALLSLPIYVVIAMPRMSLRRGWGRLAGLLIALVVVAAVIFLGLNQVLQIIEVPRTYDPFVRLERIAGQQAFILQALAAYLFSPGRSLFVFSPVLLLALPGGWLLARGRRWRQLLTAVTGLLVFVLGYALLRHENWYGGLAWGPRYLVPATPFGMLATLPVIEWFWCRMNSRGRQWSWRTGLLLALIVASIWVQLNGVLISQTAYFTYMDPRPEVPWIEGTWQPALTPLVVIPRLFASTPLDFAWLRVGAPGLVMLLGALLLIGVSTVLLWHRGGLAASPSGQDRLVLLGGPLLVIVVLLSGLWSIRHDPVYFGDFGRLQELLPLIAEAVQPEDIIILPGDEYQAFMMNYYRGRAPVYTLRTAWGERPSPEQPPRVENSNPDMLIQARQVLFLDSLPEYTGRVWVLNNHGPFSTFAVRPVEWYMARHYFPLETVETSDVTRLVGFDVTADAPEEAALRWPAVRLDTRFGDEVTLVGFDIPAPRSRVGPYPAPDPDRTIYRPGETVSLSLLWLALEAPESDYNVGVFLVGPSGAIVERHTAPQGGFRPMNTWQAGSYVRDNHALLLPADLPPGQYAIWVKVYVWQTGEPLSVQGDYADPDGTAAILATIAVE
ncbi:MAG: hypothetical protein JXN59_07095 [Anaerolineae bacterium]|nr:hypothetical protein [Anaerolineae bacterium]